MEVVVNRSLRWEIEEQMKRHNYSMSQLAESIGMNYGNLCAVLNGVSRSMTIGQLDALTVAFGQVPGWLYELYTEECLSEGKLSRPRLIPYLVRCAEVGRDDCIEAVVSTLQDFQKSVTIFFEVAEKLFEKGRQQESARFYQLAIDNTKDHFSEMLATSHYRLFVIEQGTDSEKNWKSLIRFEPFRKRLPEGDQLDALLKLAKVCYSLEKWDEVEKYADELEELSSILHDLRAFDKIKTERHLVYYLGMGLLFKGIALQEKWDYEQAKKYVHAYADLGWFNPLDASGQIEVDKFKVWAKANFYILEMLTGNASIVNEYANYLASIDRLNETLTGLMIILKSANSFNFCVDHVLERFSESINRFNSFYGDLINSGRYLWFRYYKAIYEFNRSRYDEGIQDTLWCLSLAKAMTRYEDFSCCISLFEKHRNYATEQQIAQYQSIVIREETDEK